MNVEQPQPIALIQSDRAASQDRKQLSFVVKR